MVIRRRIDDRWIWLGLLGVGIVGALLLLIAIAMDDDDGTRDRARRSTTVATVAMPLAVGADHARAAATIEALGLVVDTFPVASDRSAGQVTAQVPSAGTQVRRGDLVRLDVALGPVSPGFATIPDITGPPGPIARARAREAGFTVRTRYRDAPSREEVGEVLLQEPAAGARARRLTQITVYVGR